MKKIVFTLLLLFGQLYAMERESTLKLYHHLFRHLFHKEVISVYVEDREYQKVFASSPFIRLVPYLKDADFVMITSDRVLEEVQKRKLSSKTILFATKYKYLEASKRIIGAFYWRKSRSQYLFLQDRLNEHNISLPAGYSKFILDEL